MVDPKPHSSGMKIFKRGLLDRGFVVSKVDPCLFMFNIMICVVYVHDCFFWARSQYDIFSAMNYFKT